MDLYTEQEMNEMAASSQQQEFAYYEQEFADYEQYLQSTGTDE